MKRTRTRDEEWALLRCHYRPKKKRTRAEKKALIRYHFGRTSGDEVALFEWIMIKQRAIALQELSELIANFLAENSGREPPRIPEFLLTLIATSEQAEAACGDLNERYSRELASLGCYRAKRLYWARVLRSLWPFLWLGIGRLIKWAVILSTLNRFLG
jgi:hypothetical protein